MKRQQVMKWRWLAMAMLIAGGWAVPRGVQAADAIDESPLPVEVEEAFPKLRIPLPVAITNAGDGSGRLFVCSQTGKILAFPNDPAVEEAAVFLDIVDQVMYKEKENEEGLLGLAFHPKYKENGQFFVYYTTRSEAHTCVISRFKVSKDNPNQADRASEEELLRIPAPYWNHKGGTLAFGPDGMLYVGLGDGGNANDPHKNGQNMQALLGKILRIDVDHHDPGMKYAIPKDNPFAEKPTQGRGEIWASGIRNIWRLSFDRETGALWAADVGQNLWEEINIITRGGNYGWNLREAKHDFTAKSDEDRAGLIDPIWEYHHDVGKSITGGHVYRGKRVPALTGHYLYGDYVAGKIWALKYDEANKQVVANRPITSRNLPVYTFGEGEDGEVYMSTQLGGGVIFRFKPKS